jgi:hypothetical protein
MRDGTNISESNVFMKCEINKKLRRQFKSTLPCAIKKEPFYFLSSEGNTQKGITLRITFVGL